MVRFDLVWSEISAMFEERSPDGDVDPGRCLFLRAEDFLNRFFFAAARC
jgi:hypothetical protein